MQVPTGGAGCLHMPETMSVPRRYRVACGLKALDYVHAASLVMVHDWSNRIDQYRPLLEYYHIKEMVDNLVVLRPKLEYDKEAAKQLLAQYYSVPE